MALEPGMFVLFSAMAASLGVISVGAGVSVVRDWRARRPVEDALRDLESLRVESRSARASVLRPEEVERPLHKFLASFRKLAEIDVLLAKAGLGWSLERFVLSATLCALLLGLPWWVFAGQPYLGLIGLFVGAWLPGVYVRLKATRRIRALEAQLPAAIDHLTRAVRAGHPLSAGLQMLAEESPEPIAEEFRAVFEEQRWGMPFEDALLGLGDRIDLPDVRILITAVLVQREVGGNLAEILEKVSATMRARFTIRRQVRVYTAQGRMSGYVLAALPIVVGALISLINPTYMNPLFTHPIGKALLGFAMVLQLMGFLWIRRIVNVEY
jgi:tight adherence protein B